MIDDRRAPSLDLVTSDEELPELDEHPTDAPAAAVPLPTSDAPVVAALPAVHPDFADPAARVILHVKRVGDTLHLRPFIEGRDCKVRVMPAARNPASSSGHGVAGIHIARTLSEAAELKAILRLLRTVAGAGGDPWLCIDEVGNTGIPWELLSYDEPVFKPLGVDFVTWRRYEDLDEDDRPLPVQWEQRAVIGSIASFCSDDVIKFWKPDGHVAHAGTFAELRTALGEARAGTALVYVLCHFNLGGKSRFGRSDQHPGTDEHAIDEDFLRRCELRLLHSVRPIVFVNACGTNRSQTFTPQLSGTQSPLMDRFRARGATGVIGTVDLVEGHSAAATGEKIIQLARTSRLRVPELLRELRRDAHRRLGPYHTTDDAAAEYFHAFAYVYAGAPGAYLELE